LPYELFFGQELLIFVRIFYLRPSFARNFVRFFFANGQAKVRSVVVKLQPIVRHGVGQEKVKIVAAVCDRRGRRS
jgi:hypothetical protein